MVLNWITKFILAFVLYDIYYRLVRKDCVTETFCLATNLATSEKKVYDSDFVKAASMVTPEFKSLALEEAKSKANGVFISFIIFTILVLIPQGYLIYRFILYTCKRIDGVMDRARDRAFGMRFLLFLVALELFYVIFGAIPYWVLYGNRYGPFFGITVAVWAVESVFLCFWSWEFKRYFDQLKLHDPDYVKINSRANNSGQASIVSIIQ